MDEMVVGSPLEGSWLTKSASVSMLVATLLGLAFAVYGLGCVVAQRTALAELRDKLPPDIMDQAYYSALRNVVVVPLGVVAAPRVGHSSDGSGRASVVISPPDAIMRGTAVLDASVVEVVDGRVLVKSVGPTMAFSLHIALFVFPGLLLLALGRRAPSGFRGFDLVCLAGGVAFGAVGFPVLGVPAWVPLGVSLCVVTAPLWIKVGLQYLAALAAMFGLIFSKAASDSVRDLGGAFGAFWPTSGWAASYGELFGLVMMLTMTLPMVMLLLYVELSSERAIAASTEAPSDSARQR